MITPCPHCQTEIEIDATTIAALAGQSHFACPGCQGAVPVPGRRPGTASAHRGLNRNFLILGTLALLVLGGLGFYLASQKSGDAHNTTKNIRNEILNNTYFSQLIASGVTTREELEAIADIRPYGDGFIGISKEALTWGHAQALAKRTGAGVLAADDTSSESRNKLVKWLGEVFRSHLSSPAWVLEQSEAGVLAGSEILAVKKGEGARKALLLWDTKKNPHTAKERVDGLVANGQWQDVLIQLSKKPVETRGTWQMTEKGMQVPVEQFGGFIHTLTEPLHEFEARVRYASPGHHRLNIMFPSPAGSSFFSMSPFRRTMSLGRGAGDGNHVKPLEFSSGGNVDHELFIQVKPDSIRVTLDGRLIYNVPDVDWAAVNFHPQETRLGLELNNGTGIFHSFEIRIPAEAK
jgi:hypothetical protein